MPRADARRVLAAGADASAFVSAGSPDQPDLCRVRAGLEPDAAAAFLRWRVDSHLVGVDGDRIMLDVGWERVGSSGSRFNGRRSVVLRSGQSHLLDAVTAQPGQASGCASLLVRLEAFLERDVGEQLLAYRAWLTHEHEGKLSNAAPLEVIGAPGQAVPFRFRPLRWDLSGRRVEEATAPLVEMDVFGTLNGTMTAGGAVDVALEVSRRIRFSGARGGTGWKRFVASPGEAVTVEIPIPSGEAWSPLGDQPPAALAPGVRLERGGIVVSYDTVFAGDRLTLTIVVHRVR